MLSKYITFYKSTTNIFILLILAILFGFYYADYTSYLKPFGDVFISLIKMMLIPVVLFSIINSTSNINKHSQALKIGSFALIYFFVSCFIAGLFGAILALYLQPGSGVVNLPSNLFGITEDVKSMSVSGLNFWDFIFNLIPLNPAKAISDGKLLPILFFALFFGIAVSYINNNKKEIFIDSISVINDSLMWMISKIMYLSPIAIFCLISYLIGNLGLEILFLLTKLFIVLILACILWIYVFLGIFIILFSNITYINFVKNTFSLILFAFSTSSSMVSLPKNFTTCDSLKINQNTSRFILPLGANLNMNGSAFYYTIMTIFFAQMFQIPIDTHTIILIALTASIGAMATPGIPGASLTIIMVMMVANVPLIGIPIFFTIDRILDMFITTVNVVGDTVCCAIADKFVS